MKLKFRKKIRKIDWGFYELRRKIIKKHLGGGGGVVFFIFRRRRDRLNNFQISAAAGFLPYFSAANGAAGVGAHL